MEDELTKLATELTQHGITEILIKSSEKLNNYVAKQLNSEGAIIYHAIKGAVIDSNIRGSFMFNGVIFHVTDNDKRIKNTISPSPANS